MWTVACLLDLLLEVAAITGSGIETIRCLNSCNDGWLLLRYGLKAEAQHMFSLRLRQRQHIISSDYIMDLYMLIQTLNSII